MSKENQMPEEWQKVSSDYNDMWDPESSLGITEISGKLVDIRENVGANNSNIYTLEQENGEKISFWGNTVLDGKFKTIELGTFCKVEFLGRVKGKNNRDYKSFDVFTRGK